MDLQEQCEAKNMLKQPLSDFTQDGTGYADLEFICESWWEDEENDNINDNRHIDQNKGLVAIVATIVLNCQAKNKGHIISPWCIPAKWKKQMQLLCNMMIYYVSNSGTSGSK